MVREWIIISKLAQQPSCFAHIWQKTFSITRYSFVRVRLFMRRVCIMCCGGEKFREAKVESRHAALRSERIISPSRNMMCLARRSDFALASINQLIESDSADTKWQVTQRWLDVKWFFFTAGCVWVRDFDCGNYRWPFVASTINYRPRWRKKNLTTVFGIFDQCLKLNVYFF